MHVLEQYQHTTTHTGLPIPVKYPASDFVIHTHLDYFKKQEYVLKKVTIPINI
jgi:hypothetical protein